MSTSLWVLGFAGMLSIPDAASLHDELARLASGMRVLYVAAHPDDEHSELLAYLASGRHVDVAYLSLTRGSGGQNRIGSEQGSALGVLRTLELLQARRVDGAEQLFTRALDFGFSKSAEETLQVWGDDAILADVVYAIRLYRPHVIITRFPETGETHGHHLASARLARRAFAMAGDPARYPDPAVAPWSPVRLVHDVPNWAGETPHGPALSVDIGGFDSWRGRSYGEIAAESRSQHQSQGFGTLGKRGRSTVTLEHLEGPRASRELFEGITGDWDTLPDGTALGAQARAAFVAFDPANPDNTVPALLALHRSLEALQPGAARDRLLGQVDALVVGCAGLYVDVRSPEPGVHPGGAVTLAVEALRRSPVSVRIESIAIDVATASGRRAFATSDAPVDLEVGVAATPSLAITVPDDAAASTLPWLAGEGAEGRHDATGLSRVAPWPEPPLAATFTLRIAGVPMTLRRAVRHVHGDPVLGERAREVEVLPAVLVTPLRPVSVAAPGGHTTMRFEARGAPGRYEVRLEAPAGWTIAPEVATVEIADASPRELGFDANAGSGAVAGVVAAAWRKVGGGEFTPALQSSTLDHPHIPERSVLLPSHTRLLPVALQSLAGHPWRVGYVEGTGDEVITSLGEAGMRVAPLTPDDLGGDLSAYDAIVIGARAYNRTPALHDRNDALVRYAEAGGTVIVQYQTVNRLEQLTGAIGPARLKIGRGRVTDQNAAVELLAPDHPALTTPHHIGPADFVGWVQERGLYFAEEWDAAYKPLLRMNDPGEKPSDGALLVAAKGKGHFVYTGLAFFRQLPAGNAGAYKLFENLVALGRPAPTTATSRDGSAAHATEAAAAHASHTYADDPPPFLGTWTRLYVGVGTLFVALVGIFFWLSRRYG